jgi:hypothetical protein
MLKVKNTLYHIFIGINMCRLFLGIFILRLLLNDALAENICKKKCAKDEFGILKFSPGHVYDYNFESLMTVGLEPEIDENTLRVSGVAKFYSEGFCGYTLQLSALKIYSGKGSVERKLSGLIQKPVRFYLENDAIDPTICTDSRDSVYSLNIKRAIISLFSQSQNEIETDVFGECPTLTKLTSLNGSYVIKKSRHLTKCKNRSDFATSFATQETLSEIVKSSILINADFSKEAKIQNGLLDYVKAVEEYNFFKISKKSPEVSAKVLTTLKIRNTKGSKASAPPLGSYEASIIFEKPSVIMGKNILALKKIISEMLNLTEDYIQKGSSNHFIELLRLMRSADMQTLLELSNVAFENKKLARKIYLDALLRTGTVEAVKAIIKQVWKMSDQEKKLAILSLDLVKGFDEETLLMTQDLISREMPKEIYLMISRLVSKFCKSHDCGENFMKPITAKFEENLKNCKAFKKKEEEHILYVLKGISSSPDIAKNMVNTVQQCSHSGISNRIRVAAVEVFKSISCESSVREKALSLFTDFNEDSEVRIEAYLALITCPDEKLAKSIENVVNKEHMSQVGGFVVSNLEKIKYSTDAALTLQKKYLGNIIISKKFSKNLSRYSVNREFSYNFEGLGLSASSDYSLIYSQYGFLPRSLHIQTKSEIFGKNINLFEANIRQENLERVFEYLLGPKGLLNKNFDEIMKTHDDSKQPNKGRDRRSIADEVNKVSKRYKSFDTRNFANFNFDLSVKLFGSEMYFLSLGNNIPNTLDDIIQKLSQVFDNSKKQLSSINKEFYAFNSLVDNDVIYPTGLGIPLVLSAQVFASTKFNFAMDLDIDSILEQEWRKPKYRFKLVPSVDVHSKFKVGFNGFLLGVGVSLESSAQSATGSDIRFDLENESGFNLNILLPRERIEFLDIELSSNMYVEEEEKPTKKFELRIMQNGKADKSSFCFNQLEFLGLNICFDSTNEFKENSTDILHSPYHLSLYMTSENNLKIKGFHSRSDAAGVQQWGLNYSTPKENHETNVLFELGGHPSLFGRLSIKNQQFHVVLESGFRNNNKEIVLYGQYAQSNNISKTKIGFIKSNNELHPIIEISDKNGKRDNINGYRVNGKAIIENANQDDVKYVLDKIQITSNEKPILAFTGWLDVSRMGLNTEMEVLFGDEIYKTNSNMKLLDGNYNISFFGNNARTPDKVLGGSFNLEIEKEKMNLAFHGKTFDFGIETSVKVQYSKEDLMSHTTVKSDLILTSKNINIFEMHTDLIAKDSHNFHIFTEIKKEQKDISLSIDFDSRQKSLYDYLIKINGKINQYILEVLSESEFNGHHYILNNLIKTSKGLYITAKGELGQRYSLQDVFVDIHGNLKINKNEKEILWHIKCLGVPEKTNSELKIFQDKEELITYNAEIQHPQDKISAAKISLYMNGFVKCNLELKMAKFGKGDLSITFEPISPDSNAKTELNSKFSLLAPKYDIEVTIDLKTGKKIYFKSENILDKTRASSKNLLEAFGEIFNLELNTSLKGDWKKNGEIFCNFSFKFPSERELKGAIRRKIITNPKTGLISGNFDVDINDQFSRTSKQSLLVTGKVDKLNINTRDLSALFRIAYTDISNRQYNIVSHLKHLPKGSNKMFDFGITLNGDNELLPFETNIVAEEYNSNYLQGHAKFQVSDLASGNLNLKVFTLNNKTMSIASTIYSNKTTWKNMEHNFNFQFYVPPSNGSKYLELNFNQKIQQDVLKFKTIYSNSANEAQFKIDFDRNTKSNPLAFLLSLQKENSKNPTNNEIKNKYSIELNGPDHFLKSNMDILFRPNKSLNFKLLFDSSLKPIKKFEISFNGLLLSDNSATASLQTKSSEDLLSIDFVLHRAALKRGFDLKVSVPAEKPIIFSYAIITKSENEFQIDLKIKDLLDLDFNSHMDFQYISIEIFYLKATCFSQKLNLNNYDFSINNKNGMVQIVLRNDDKMLFEGSAKLDQKIEKNKIIIEGQGQIQFNNNKNQPATFRLSRQKFELPSDKEFGYSFNFNGNFGIKNAVSTLKITNKDINIKLSVCEEKKQCTNIQLQSIIEKDEKDLSFLQHSLLVLLDLRDLGYPYEFDFQSKAVKQGLKYQYSLDSSIISNNNLKYQILVNSLPTGSKIQLVLPHRTILLESIHITPSQGEFFGHYEKSFKFFIDKAKEPKNSINFIISLDILNDENTFFQCKPIVKFEHPSIRKMLIDGTLTANRKSGLFKSEIIFDIFKQFEQRIITNSEIQLYNSFNGFNLTSRNSISMPNGDFNLLLKGETAFNFSTSQYSTSIVLDCAKKHWNSNFLFHGSAKSVHLSTSLLDEQLLFISAESKIESSSVAIVVKMCENMLFQLSTTAQPSQNQHNFDQKSSSLKSGQKNYNDVKFTAYSMGQELVRGRIGLHVPNFLETSFQIKPEEFRQFLELSDEKVKNSTFGAINRMKARYKELQLNSNNVRKIFVENIVDFSQFAESYRANIKEIHEELRKDPSFLSIADTFISISSNFLNTFELLFKEFNIAIETIKSSVLKFFESATDVLSELILPVWQNIISLAKRTFGELQVHISKFWSEASKIINELMENNGVKNFAKLLFDSVKPIAELLVRVCENIHTILDELQEFLYEFGNKIPSSEEILSYILKNVDEFKIREKLVGFLELIFDQLKLSSVSPELTTFLEELQKYILAKIQQESYNHKRMHEILPILFNKAVVSVVNKIEATPILSTDFGFEALRLGFSTLYQAIVFVTELPSNVNIRSNLLNPMLSIFNFEHVFSILPFDGFQLKGHLIEGGHVFTFDGDYFNFNGSCKYILAQDSIDNNFTVVASMAYGKLKSIFLIEKETNFIELNDLGSLKVKGSYTEFPYNNNGVRAFRLYNSVWLHSEFGVSAMCSTDLKVCHVGINAFYSGKLRGLFGNGNFEPYDDHTLIDGTISKNVDHFINNYSLGKCPAALSSKLALDFESHMCQDIFGIGSPLAIGTLLMTKNHFEEACKVEVSRTYETEKETAACNIAFGYGSALMFSGKFAMLPTRCLKCTGSNNQKEIGQNFVVKLPNNKADVVFVVDFDIKPFILQNLISNIILEIREVLKVRGFTDIHIGLIAYNKTQMDPVILTSDNGKLNYKGNLMNVNLNSRTSSYQTYVRQFISDSKLIYALNLINDISQSLKVGVDEKAYQLAMDYPFRSSASKTIVAVRSDGIQSGSLLQYLKNNLFERNNKGKSITWHLIGPVDDLAIEGVVSEKLVGFNNRLIATTEGKDAKKRQKLQFKNNLGVDFVLNSNGWVFTSQNFEKLKQQDQKKVVNQIMSSIGDSMFKTEIVADCACSSVHGIYAEHKCSTKSYAFVPNKKLKGSR